MTGGALANIATYLEMREEVEGVSQRMARLRQERCRRHRGGIGGERIDKSAARQCLQREGWIERVRGRSSRRQRRDEQVERTRNDGATLVTKASDGGPFTKSQGQARCLAAKGSWLLATGGGYLEVQGGQNAAAPPAGCNSCAREGKARGVWGGISELGAHRLTAVQTTKKFKQLYYCMRRCQSLLDFFVHR